MGDIVPVIIDYERQARDFLVSESQREPARPGQPGLRHPANRPDDQLRGDDAPALQRADGREPGADRRPGDPDVNELFIHTQPAHLQKLRGVELDTADRNIERARYLRQHFEGAEPAPN